MRKLYAVLSLHAMVCLAATGSAQTDPSKNFEVCAHWELIEQLRAYEDTLAFEQSLPDTLRREYGIPVTDNGNTAKVYRLYRCAALQDTLANLQDSLAFVRADPPTVDSDSISGITISSAILHGRVLSDGGETVTERWFKYGTSLTALNDTITAVVGVPDSIFTANLTGLTPPGTWYMAAVAKNAKGTSSGDTLQFITVAAPTMDTDSSSLRTATTATLHGKVITNGGDALTHQWFRYGTSAAALNDSIAASGAGSGTPPLTSPFSAGITGLTAATKYYFAAFGKNTAGTAAGDTLSFWTKCSVDSVSYDGHWYGVVMVGDKCWFDENLKSDQYRNGNLIPGNLDSLNWVTTTAGAQAVQDQGGLNEAANLDTYGRLYNFHAVNDSRGLCPAGWDVPTKAEWDSLYARVGGEAVAGKELKAPAPRWNGVNTNGFDVVQGGRRMPDATFAPVGGVGHAFFWTSSPNGAQAWYRYFTQYDDSYYEYFNGLRNGFSVRCIQDSTTLSAPVVDTDSMSVRTASTATLHGKVVSDGGYTLTHQWFRYGLTAASLTDSIAVTVTATPFTVGITGLSPATQYYYAAFGKNAAGTATGDTLSFRTKCSVDSVVYNSYTYGVVQIGDQCWFDENLQTTKFSDGTAIPSPATNALWAGLSTPGRAEHTAKVRTEDGLLYNWYAASDSKGLCPSGWHVPTEAAFDSLNNFLGVSTAGNQLRVGSPIWDGTNETGFSGLPSGGRAASTGNFYGYNSRAIFWSTTVATGNPSNAARAALNSATPALDMTTLDMRTGMSVRCLQD